MANQEHVERLGLESELWVHGAWRLGPAAGRASFDATPRPDLSGADLRWARLCGARLEEANLRHTDLGGVNLSGANLCGADIRGANLREANLRGAVLHGAQLGEAEFGETVFGNTDLSAASGLDTCVHSGPSTLDFRTLVRSGQLPLSFLRGCGLTDDIITYLPSLLNQPIQFYSCFISYSTQDQAFADRLYADLQNKGVRCWFAPHNIRGGKKLHEQIDEAIRMYDRLLLILSSASMNSEWVKTEIAQARRREVQENRRILFPISLVEFETLRNWVDFDSDIGKDSAREIREYFIPDFSNWKDHDTYERELGRLFSSLRAEGVIG